MNKFSHNRKCHKIWNLEQQTSLQPHLLTHTATEHCITTGWETSTLITSCETLSYWTFSCAMGWSRWANCLATTGLRFNPSENFLVALCERHTLILLMTFRTRITTANVISMIIRDMLKCTWNEIIDWILFMQKRYLCQNHKNCHLFRICDSNQNRDRLLLLLLLNSVTFIYTLYYCKHQVVVVNTIIQYMRQQSKVCLLALTCSSSS